MSPLWRDEIAISLSPRSIALVRRARGLKARVVAAAEFAVPAADTESAIARLAGALSEEIWQGAAARVVAADHPWARYAIVPWPATRLDAAARLAHARCVLGDNFGDAVADWEVTLADTPPGRPCVACAMSPALRGALEDAMAPARLTLASLQPRLIAAFNGWRHLLPADDAWFVTVAEGSLSAAHLRDGAWDRVHVARVSEDLRVELERLRAFGKLTGRAGCRMFVDAPAPMRAGPSDGIEWLQDDGDDQPHELAFLQRVSA